MKAAQPVQGHLHPASPQFPPPWLGTPPKSMDIFPPLGRYLGCWAAKGQPDMESHRSSARCVAGDGSHPEGSPKEEEGAAATLLLHRLAQGRKSVLAHGGGKNEGDALYLHLQ